MSTVTAFLSLGSNVGDRLETLTAAVYALEDVGGLVVEDVSGVYETAAWPPPDDPRHVPQDDYLNLVVRAETTRTPHELLDETRLLEQALGRDRAREQRWGPRTLDIDLLVVGDAEIDDERLTLPHPRLAERAFVLVPLSEVWPGGVLPDGRRVTSLLAAQAPMDGVELFVRLDEVPGFRIERPEGPRAPRPYLAEEAGGDDPTGRQGA